MKKYVRQFKKAIIFLILIVFAGILCAPVFLVVEGSIMSNLELNQHLKPALNQVDEFISWKWIPDYPTIKHYVNLLFYMPEFHVVYQNSMKLIVCILAGQFFAAVPAAWAFAVYRFRFRKILFFIYVVLMLIPFQVTMLSGYLVLDFLHLMNTHWAIILPAVFSTFPVFLIYRSFASISDEMISAARIDGAGEFQIFMKIGLPLGSTGILSAVVLGFLEYWNLIEQPLSYLKNEQLWPLSLYLPNIGMEEAGYAFAASVLVLIPSLLVFALGQEYLEAGIIASAMKE